MNQRLSAVCLLSLLSACQPEHPVDIANATPATRTAASTPPPPPVSDAQASRIALQAQFVDDPKAAVAQGDAMVEEVMKARGYPLAEFDQRIADLSVHHASVVQNYRAAREIAARQRQGQASTGDLRRAVVYYRELFEDLVEDRRAPDRDVGLRVEREERVESSIGRQARRPADREVEP